MFRYLLKRLALFIPALFGITLISFLIINTAPGGFIERQAAKMRFGNISSTDSGGRYNINKEVISALKTQYGFDKPILTRYWIWLKKMLTFDFGDSFIYEEPAIAVIVSKLPVSIQFGLISFLLIYLISLPLGIYKAIKNGSPWDSTSSFILIVLYAAPPLIIGALLKTYFAGGVFVDWFPPGDLYSSAYFEKDFFGKIIDRLHHFILPLLCYTLGSFTILTFLMKNSLLEHIQSDYVRTALAKGLSHKQAVLKHAVKNALVPIMTGLGNFLHFFLAGSLVVEKIFNLDGLGLLGYTSAVERDIHVLLALLVIQAILSLIGRLLSDLSLPLVDPKITFSKQAG